MNQDNNIPMEQAILSTLLMSDNTNNHLQLALDSGISYDFFYLPEHIKLAKKVISAYENDCTQPDLFQMTYGMSQKERTTLQAITNLPSQPDRLVERIVNLRKLSQLRNSTRLLKESLRAIEDGIMEPHLALSKLTDKANEIVADSSESEFHSASEGILSAMEKLQEARGTDGVTGLNTSYPDMDEQLRGLQKGRMYIIAAESGKGKSVLCFNIVSQQVTDKKRGAVFSLEMPHTETWQRILVHNTGMSANCFAGKSTNKGDLFKIKKLAEAAKDNEFEVETCDKGGQSIEQIIAAIHRLHRKKPLDYVVIDYIQLMHSQKRHNSREQEMAYISRSLKGLALQLQIPIVLPTQLNDDGKARESRSIKFDSDAFIWIKDDCIDIDKNRAGRTGVLHYELNGEFQRFSRVEKNENPNSKQN